MARVRVGIFLFIILNLKNCLQDSFRVYRELSGSLIYIELEVPTDGK